MVAYVQRAHLVCPIHQISLLPKRYRSSVNSDDSVLFAQSVVMSGLSWLQEYQD